METLSLFILLCFILITYLWYKNTKFYWKVQKISKSLGADAVDDLYKMLDGKKAKDKEKLRNDLFDLLYSDKELKKIIEKYNISREELDKEYSDLLNNGAGQWFNGFYVVSNAFCFEETLDYLIRSKDSESMGQRVETLIKFFENYKYFNAKTNIIN
jgi:hypothetical protein